MINYASLTVFHVTPDFHVINAMMHPLRLDDGRVIRHNGLDLARALRADKVYRDVLTIGDVTIRTLAYKQNQTAVKVIRAIHDLHPDAFIIASLITSDTYYTLPGDPPLRGIILSPVLSPGMDSVPPGMRTYQSRSWLMGSAARLEL